MNLITETIQTKEPPIHVYPVDDLIEHNTENGMECQCSPRLSIPEPDEKCPIIIHNALDGRE